MTRHTPRHLALVTFALCILTFLSGLGASARAQAPQPEACLSPAESFVLDKFKVGQKADFTDSTDPNGWKPQNPDEPRVIRAACLKQVLSGSAEGVKFGPEGLILQGAVVDGPLLLSNEKIPYSVSLISCTFNGLVSFINVTIKGNFNISNSVERFSAHCEGKDKSTGSVFKDQFLLINATVEGDIYARNSVFAWKPPCPCEYAHSVCDAADFEEAKVSNDAVFDGARFEGPADFEGGHFSQVLFARHAQFNHLANFVDVRVTDDLVLDGSTFASGADFSRAVVENQFSIAVGKDEQGNDKWGTNFADATDQVSFEDVNVGQLTLSAKTEFGGRPHVGGMTYKRISMNDPHKDAEAVELWFDLLNKTEYRVDCYTALESFMEKQGYSSRANAFYIRQRDREAGEAFRHSRLWGTAVWCWDSFLKYTVGYGRWPWLALIYGIVIIGVGCLVFPEDKMEILKKDEKEPKKDEKRPKYSPFWYSLDLFLPVVDLHASQMWVPVWPDAPRRVRYRDYPKFAALVVISAARNVLKFARVLKNPRPTSREAQAVKDKVRWHYMHVHALLGWILIPIGLAAITGIIK
jgi:hypothetical protein